MDLDTAALQVARLSLAMNILAASLASHSSIKLSLSWDRLLAIVEENNVWADWILLRYATFDSFLHFIQSHHTTWLYLNVYWKKEVAKD